MNNNILRANILNKLKETSDSWILQPIHFFYNFTKNEGVKSAGNCQAVPAPCASPVWLMHPAPACPAEEVCKHVQPVS